MIRTRIVPLAVAVGIAVSQGANAQEAELRAELDALRQRVAELEARLERGDPAPAGKGGVLRLSRDDLEVSLYGFLTSEAVWESHGTGGDRFLNIVPFAGGRRQDDDFFLSANATRLGLRLGSDALEDDLGLSADGLLEVDFDTPGGGPRIRHAYATLQHPRVEALLGQTWAVAAQLNPETVNSDNLFNLGNVYERVPQVRLSRELELGGGRLRAEAGLLRFFGGFDQESLDGIPLALQQPGGSTWEIRSSGTPLGQARLAWWPSGPDAYAAISVSAGRLQVEDASGRGQSVPHLLSALELVLPAWGPFQVSAEAFWGRAPGFNGGVGQTAVIGLDGEARAVESWGGFVQLAYRVSERLRCHVLFGIDDPEDRAGGVPLAIARNQTALANCFWGLLPYLDLALEVQGVRTEWRSPGRFDADDLRVTQAVYLRF